MAKKKKKIKRVVRKKSSPKKKKKIYKKPVRKIKKAQPVKTLQELKKSKDVHFRNRAEKEESLLPVSDLNAEIRSKGKRLKGNKKDIQQQRSKIKQLEKDNKKISDKRKALEQEYPFVEDARKKEIERLLNSPDYRKKNLSNEKNILKAIEGKPFDFVVDDGFKVYKISSKEFEKKWKKGEDVSLIVLKHMQKNTKETIKHYTNLIKKEGKTASKAQLKKWNRIKDALQKKLTHTIQKNIDAIENDDMSELDEYSEDDEKAYSILFRVVGFKIDRIGI